MAVYYVKNGGSDLADGLSDATAFATPDKAISIISPGDKILVKRDGKKYSPLTISSKPGTEASRCKISTYWEGDAPAISGFVEPSSWVNEGNNIWSFNDAGFEVVNLVKINGVDQPKGRWPKTGYHTITGRTLNTQVFDSVNFPTAPNFVGGELVAKKNKWVQDTQKITSQGSLQVTTEVGSIRDYAVGYGYFIQNHINCLDLPGDWCYNETEKKVYLYSITDPSSLNIQISKSQYCIYVNYSGYWDIEGIELEGSYDSGLFVRYSNHVTLNGCDVNHHGENGVRTFESTHLTVDDCDIEHCHNAGVYFRDKSTFGTVQNNRISNIIMIPGSGQNGDSQGCGIKINNTEDGAVIRNNQLENLGYIGIFTTAKDCLIEKNYAKNGCLMKSDGALFYAFGAKENVIFQDNIGENCIGNVEGTTHSGYWGVGDSAIYYADDNVTGAIFRRNVGIGGNFGVYLHNNDAVSFNNNILINNSIQVRIADDNTGGPVAALNIQNNYLEAKAGQFLYELRTIYSNLAFGTINNNTLRSVDDVAFRIRMEGSSSANYFYNLAQWQSNRSYDLNSDAGEAVDYEIIVNTSGAPSTFNLSGTYQDLLGNQYDGSIELDENESIYLYRTGDTPPPVEEYTITLVSAVGGIATGGGAYDEGDTAILVAMQNMDYKFDGWSEGGSIVSTENPWAFVVTGDRTITPVFTEVIPTPLPGVIIVKGKFRIV